MPAVLRSEKTMGDLLRRLGVSAHRVRLQPTPGTATIDDLADANDRRRGKAPYEWIDGTLVEKAVGFNESVLAAWVLDRIFVYLDTHDVGFLAGEGGVMRILPKVGRAPDVSFIAWSSLPGGRRPGPDDRVPAIVPDLAVEVLSKSNTKREMARKRREYFQAGVKRVWQIDPATATARVYTAAKTFTAIPADGVLDGETILPGFTLPLADLFRQR